MPSNGGGSWSQFFRLLRYAKPYKKFVTLQFAFMALSVGVGLLKPWPLKVLVDQVLGDQPLVLGGVELQWSADFLLLAACLAYILFHSGESLIQFGSSTVSTITTSRMIRDLRSDLLRSLQSKSMKFHDSRKIGDTVHRLTSNTTAVETAFQSGFMGTVKSTLTLTGIFGVMLAMNAFLTVISLIVIPLLFVCIRWYAKRINQVSWAHQTQEGAVSSRAQEILSSIRLVKAFGRETREQADFDRLTQGSVATRLKSTVTQNSFGFFVSLTLALGTALLFWFGAREVQRGALTVGEFLVFNAYLAMLYAPLSVLSYTTSSVQSALGGASRLFEVLDSETEISDKAGAVDLRQSRGRIEFVDVDFGYRSDQTVLSRVSFQIEPGQMVALVGETGGGKSSILNLILRFYEIRGGRIRIDDTDITEVTRDSLRRNIGLVPQDALLFSDSVKENIAYGKPSAGFGEIESAAKQAEAHDFIAKMIEGYDTQVGEGGVLLSVGQRQRIALARVFLKSARILLLDEPTSALDMETEAKILDILDHQRQGHTILVASHRLAVAARADRILFIKAGEIVERGTHQELLAREGHYARLWKAQQPKNSLTESPTV
ncbi:MAG: ABC transporter ATP-binding protein [Candidatus Omnitrophica bacterium]|nr:ABC transporter ATP-binding protein [Candidatus Omnitrophota bacterium]